MRHGCGIACTQLPQVCIGQLQQGHPVDVLIPDTHACAHRHMHAFTQTHADAHTCTCTWAEGGGQATQNLEMVPLEAYRKEASRRLMSRRSTRSHSRFSPVTGLSFWTYLFHPFFLEEGTPGDVPSCHLLCLFSDLRSRAICHLCSVWAKPARHAHVTIHSFLVKHQSPHPSTN